MTIAKRGHDEWIVPSETRPGTLYIVKQVAGDLTCDCPGHFHYGRCKHARAVAATLPQRGPSAQDTANIFLAHRTPR